MHAIHDVKKAQGVHLACACSCPADIHTPYGTFFEEDHAATSHGLSIVGMANPNSWYIGDVVEQDAPPCALTAVTLEWGL
jgi:hypothetical protein